MDYNSIIIHDAIFARLARQEWIEGMNTRRRSTDILLLPLPKNSRCRLQERHVPEVARLAGQPLRVQTVPAVRLKIPDGEVQRVGI
jgi:hypothetical protein